MAELGVFVHGVLTFGHMLGLVYNMRRRNWFDVAAHGGALLYDAWAVNKHLDQYREENHNEPRTRA